LKRELSVTEGAAGERLDLFLTAALDLTRSQVQRRVRSGFVLVNGNAERSGYLVRVADHVTIDQPDKAATSVIAPELPVIYEDADVLVVDKPAGLAVHHGSGMASEATLADFARLHTSDPDPERPGIVHRLDRDTSGLLILARSAGAKAFMQHEFAERSVQKTYLVLAIGQVEPGEAVIRLPIDRDPGRPLRRAVVAGGREAITRYRTLANFDGFSLLEAKPETGRTHQLRVHFAAIGHPVAGDITYGPAARPLGLSRQFLHATSLEFTSPSGQTVQLTSPLPPDLAGVVRALGGSGIIGP
jgi:23S rRNA pseudouridine1911/1915/1917 synthase